MDTFFAAHSSTMPGPRLNASRLVGLPPYPMAEIRAAVEAAAATMDVINLAIGDPDRPPAAHVATALADGLSVQGAHRYGVGGGIPAMRQALADHYARRFRVELDPAREVLATNGAQGGLSSLLLTLVNPGDGVAVMDPGYPVHLSNPIVAGGVLVRLPATPDDDFLQAFDAACRRAAPAIVAAVVGWPAAPSGQVASRAFLGELVSLARRHGVWLLHDAANIELWLDAEAEPPPSILEVPGAREVAIELYSLSKPYNLAAWRVGFAVGNAEVIEALQRLRSHADHGHPPPVQAAAIAALAGPQGEVRLLRGVYRRRRDVFVSGLRAAGWAVPYPAGGFSVWAKQPRQDMTSMEFMAWLVKASGVCCAPGSLFGPAGEGHVRFTLVQPEDRLEAAATRIGEALQRIA